jgi:hypothetical protein
VGGGYAACKVVERAVSGLTSAFSIPLS